ncbi:thiamine phosphate synthase [Phycisphaerales bacterium AB-hyl4]|uniref:Thiamine-phosphate synthase n=1 Tax=Natronomicrosphaera hydrolytica TaxID=3242702 RepID=A0ABV4U2H6_9BACT
MTDVGRILDANANRAREALRVMEEAARFVLDDAAMTEAIKQLRHDLAAAVSGVAGLEASRDTPGDVGTRITTEAEQSRAGVAEVAIAAGKRLSEALRAMEEYGKTLPRGDDVGSPAFASRVESLRYRGYDIEQRLTAAMGTGRRQQWRLCVLISESLCPDRDWLTVAEACIEGGADCLQLREKSLEAGALLERASRLVELARPSGVSVVVNDRPDVALLAGADGVHVGQGDLSVRGVRQLVGRQLLVGVSTSKLAQAEQALADGADYCGVGPMFETTTKLKKHIVGPGYLKQYVGWGRLPHLAIGGVSPSNVAALVAAGVEGVAVSSCVCGDASPRAVCERLLSKLADASVSS